MLLSKKAFCKKYDTKICFLCIYLKIDEFSRSLRKTYSNWWFSQVCSIKTVEVRKLTDKLETETMIIEIPMLFKLILEMSLVKNWTSIKYITCSRSVDIFSPNNYYGRKYLFNHPFKKQNNSNMHFLKNVIIS